MTSTDYTTLTQAELIELLKARDAQANYGLVWERDEIDQDIKINDEFVAVRLDSELSCGEGPHDNLIIEGDNYDALRHLLMTHAGLVNCVYLDMPYNTGRKDFVYNDRYFDPNSRFRHSTWLEFVSRRLCLVRDLMADTGVIFLSIDDIELYNLRLLMDRIFGEANFVANIVWKNATDNNPTRVAVEHEYILVYTKKKSSNPAVWKSADIITKKTLLDKFKELCTTHADPLKLEAAYIEWFRTQKPYLQPMQEYDQVDEGGPFTGSRSVHNPGKPGYFYDVFHETTGKPCTPPQNGYRFPPETMDQLLKDKRIIFGKDENKIIELKLYASEYKQKLPGFIDLDGRKGPNELKDIFGKAPFNNPKPSELILELLTFASGPNDIVLDCFAGSGTTGHAVLKMNKLDGGNRKFILVSSTEKTDAEPTKNICKDVCAERMRRVITGYRNKGEGEFVEGIGGSFAYLRAEPVLQHRLESELDDQSVWISVLLAHGLPVWELQGKLGWAVTNDGTGIAYPTGTRKSDMDNLASIAKEHDGPVVVYSWSPARITEVLPQATVFSLPDTLLKNFRRSLTAVRERFNEPAEGPDATLVLKAAQATETIEDFEGVAL
jgi:adenine-specific DNA-methyltransferase